MSVQFVCYEIDVGAYLIVFDCRIIAAHGKTEPVKKLLIVIANQDHAHHMNYAKLSKGYIDRQAQAVKDKLSVEVIISTDMFPDTQGLWAFFPLFKE